jgi:hypothetical protein
MAPSCRSLFTNDVPEPEHRRETDSPLFERGEEGSRGRIRRAPMLPGSNQCVAR